jgi:cytochrome c oxidase cbb3-type subunit 2
MTAHLAALRKVGVPYSDEDVKQADADFAAQADPAADTAGLAKRYPKMQARDFDGNPDKLTEMDALVAYLQMLGTLVDFESAAPQETAR